MTRPPEWRQSRTSSASSFSVAQLCDLRMIHTAGALISTQTERVSMQRANLHRKSAADNWCVAGKLLLYPCVCHLNPHPGRFQVACLREMCFTSFQTCCLTFETHLWLPSGVPAAPSGLWPLFLWKSKAQRCDGEVSVWTCLCDGIPPGREPRHSGKAAGGVATFPCCDLQI